MHGMNRYVIGFGFEYDRDGNPTGIEHSYQAAGIVEQVAASIELPAYSLRFGPGCWQNERGVRVSEQGGTVEFIASADVSTARFARSFAELLREELRQECVVYYIQPVSLFEYV